MELSPICKRDRRRRTNFNSKFSSRGRQRLRDRAHAANHVAIKALQLMFSTAQQVKQQSDCGARLVRSPMLAINIVGEKHGFYFFRRVVVVEEFAQTTG